MRTIYGWEDGKTWTFTGEMQQGSSAKRLQVTIKPAKNGFTFSQHVSTNGSAWKQATEISYVRLP